MFRYILIDKSQLLLLNIGIKQIHTVHLTFAGNLAFWRNGKINSHIVETISGFEKSRR
jgi:hypothetical protein